MAEGKCKWCSNDTPHMHSASDIDAIKAARPRSYLFGPDMIGAFHKAGLVPECVQRIDIRIEQDEFVRVTAEFSLATEQLADIVDACPRRQA